MIIPLGKEGGYNMTADQVTMVKANAMSALSDKCTNEWPKLDRDTSLERGLVICLNVRNDYKLIVAVRNSNSWGFFVEYLMDSHGKKSSGAAAMNWGSLQEARYRIL